MSDYTVIRAELDAAHKSREDLMKWKGIAVTAVGAAALGFSGTGSKNAPLALLILPFACVYIDLLCRNLSVRSKRVSQFLCSENAEDAIVRFEKYYALQRGNALESLALV